MALSRRDTTWHGLMAFNAHAQEKYSFTAHTFQAAGFANRAEYRAAHGSDLFLTNIEEYDHICKASVLPWSASDIAVSRCFYACMLLTTAISPAPSGTICLSQLVAHFESSLSLARNSECTHTCWIVVAFHA